MRIALHSVLHDGAELGYEQAHRVVPDDLLAALRRAGIRDWAIWRDGRDLFHVVDCDDFDAAQRALADDPVNQRWQETMAAYVARFTENPEGAAGMGLRHVWTLREQAGS
jgi:L-rhamnose mutarotase